MLDRVIEVFRERGYEGSSMADIEKSTGLNASSVYNTFGSKEALFKRALARYEVVRLAGFAAVLGAGTGGLSDLHQALDLQHVESLSEWGRGGCLAINSMIELGSRTGDTHVHFADFRRQLGDAIRQPLDRAVALGEISQEQVPAAVALLVTFTLGVGVLMRSGASDLELAPQFEAAHALVDAWKIRT